MVISSIFDKLTHHLTLLIIITRISHNKIFGIKVKLFLMLANDWCGEIWAMWLKWHLNSSSLYSLNLKLKVPFFFVFFFFGNDWLEWQDDFNDVIHSTQFSTTMAVCGVSVRSTIDGTSRIGHGFLSSSGQKA